jgi:hypothetical protein
VNARDARLLFDECLPYPFVMRLVHFVGPGSDEGPVIRHLFDFAPSGTYDENWLPQLKDGGWTVISADVGRQPNKNRGKKFNDPQKG